MAHPVSWRASFQEQLDRPDEPAAAWQGLRPSTVRARRAESRDVASFELAPDDGAELAEHLPGQCVTVVLDL